MSLPLSSASGRPHYSLLLPTNFIHLTRRGAMQEAMTGVCVSFCCLTIVYILAPGWQMLTKKPLWANEKTIKILIQGSVSKKLQGWKNYSFFLFLMVIISLKIYLSPLDRLSRVSTQLIHKYRNNIQWIPYLFLTGSSCLPWTKAHPQH